MTLIFLSRDSQYFFDILTDNFFFLSQCFCSWFFLLLNKGPCIQHLSLSLSVCLVFCLFGCLFVWLSVCLVVCLLVCLFVCLSVCLVLVYPVFQVIPRYCCEQRGPADHPSHNRSMTLNQLFVS